MRQNGYGHEGIFEFRSAEEMGAWLAPLFDGICTRHGHGVRAKRRNGSGSRTGRRDSSRS